MLEQGHPRAAEQPLVYSPARPPISSRFSIRDSQVVPYRFYTRHGSGVVATYGGVSKEDCGSSDGESQQAVLLHGAGGALRFRPRSLGTPVLP